MFAERCDWLTSCDSPTEWTSAGITPWWG